MSTAMTACCSCFTGQMDNNMSMNIDMSDIHMHAVRKSTNLVEVLLWLVVNFSWRENSPHGHLGQSFNHNILIYKFYDHV